MHAQSLQSCLTLYDPKDCTFFGQGSKPGEAVSSRHCWPGALVVLGIQREKNGEMFLIEIHDYWKNHNLIIWTFVSKVTSLLFNMLS